jgi:hypothetical protein
MEIGRDEDWGSEVGRWVMELEIAMAMDCPNGRATAPLYPQTPSFFRCQLKTNFERRLPRTSFWIDGWYAR